VALLPSLDSGGGFSRPGKDANALEGTIATILTKGVIWPGKTRSGS
jgi:hypothetical protein